MSRDWIQCVKMIERDPKKKKIMFILGEKGHVYGEDHRPNMAFN